MHDDTNDIPEGAIPISFELLRRVLYRTVEMLNRDPRKGYYKISKQTDETFTVSWVNEAKSGWLWSVWRRLIRRPLSRQSVAFVVTVEAGHLQLVADPDYYDVEKLFVFIMNVCGYVLSQEHETPND